MVLRAGAPPLLVFFILATRNGKLVLESTVQELIQLCDSEVLRYFMYLVTVMLYIYIYILSCEILVFCTLSLLPF